MIKAKQKLKKKKRVLIEIDKDLMNCSFKAESIKEESIAKYKAKTAVNSFNNLDDKNTATLCFIEYNSTEGTNPQNSNFRNAIDHNNNKPYMETSNGRKERFLKGKLYILSFYIL